MVRYADSGSQEDIFDFLNENTQMPTMDPYALIVGDMPENIMETESESETVYSSTNPKTNQSDTSSAEGNEEESSKQLYSQDESVESIEWDLDEYESSSSYVEEDKQQSDTEYESCIELDEEVNVCGAPPTFPQVSLAFECLPLT